MLDLGLFFCILAGAVCGLLVFVMVVVVALSIVRKVRGNDDDYDYEDISIYNETKYNDD